MHPSRWNDRSATASCAEEVTSRSSLLTPCSRGPRAQSERGRLVHWRHCSPPAVWQLEKNRSDSGFSARPVGRSEQHLGQRRPHVVSSRQQPQLQRPEERARQSLPRSVLVAAIAGESFFPRDRTMLRRILVLHH